MLNLRFKGSNSFLFINATKIYQFKAKDPEIKLHPLCLRKILKGVANFFSVDYNAINTNNILDIHRHLIKER